VRIAAVAAAGDLETSHKRQLNNKIWQTIFGIPL